MGEEVTSGRGAVISAVADETADGRSRGTSTTDTGTDNNRRADGRGTGAETETEKEVSGVVLLTEAQQREEKRRERNEKRRARYAEQKAQNGQTVKPRKVNGTKKTTAPTVDTTQISMILTTVSGIVASRPNMAHWQLTPTEVEQLAKPIGNMMAKSEAFAQFGEHADTIALVTAVFTIMLPRIIISLQLTKTNKEKTKNVARVENKARTDRKQESAENRKDSPTDNRSNEPSTVNDSSNGIELGYVGESIVY